MDPYMDPIQIQAANPKARESTRAKGSKHEHENTTSIHASNHNDSYFTGRCTHPVPDFGGLALAVNLV